MPQEITIPIIGNGSTPQEIYNMNILMGKVAKVKLVDIMVAGVDSGQVGNSWNLRLGNDWVMEEMNVLKTVTNTNSLDYGTHNRSGARDISVFIDASPVVRTQYQYDCWLVYNKTLDQQKQLFTPTFVLSSDGTTKPTWTTAWVKLQLWLKEEVIETQNTNFLLKQWRN